MRTNSEALQGTLNELRRQNRIAGVLSAQVTAVESMAEALDFDPSNAALWKQYREALKELLGDNDRSSLDNDINTLFNDDAGTDVRHASTS